MVRFEDEAPQWLADNQPSLKGNHGQRPQAHHTWNCSLNFSVHFCNESSTLNHLLTAKCDQKALDFAHKRSKDKISESKSAARSKGANNRYKKIGYSQVDQDVVEVGSQLLVLDGACNGEQVDKTAHGEYEKHVYGHGIKGACIG